MKYILDHADAEITVKGANEDKKKITVKLKSNKVFMPVGTCETKYPIELIRKILRFKGPAYLCDEILRDESPEYLENQIYNNVFGYIQKERFRDTHLLDFGCGCGGSTMVLGRMLPDTRITGVEFQSSSLEVARLRAAYYKTGDRMKFFVSPNEKSLPEDIGDFDFIILSAVYEHLLPQERNVLLPLLWRRLKPNGIIFINQTPYRWSAKSRARSLYQSLHPAAAGCWQTP